MSQALVSLVLNGRRDGISPATYERIWQHAALCRYRAKGMNLAAAAAASLPPQIGVIFASSLNLSRLGNYFSHAQHGLHAGLQETGAATVFLGSEKSLDADRLARLFPTGHFFHGLALFGEFAPPLLQKLLSHVPNLVSISARVTGSGHTVNGDDAQSLGLIVNHLHTLGHRRIGWLGGKAGRNLHETRFAAFRAALANLDLAPAARYEITRDDADRAEGAEAIHSLLPLARRRDFPSAFVCYNSLMAAGAVLALNHAGWTVPTRLSIAGADLPRSFAREESFITGAGTCPESLGHAAARLLLAPSPASGIEYEQLTLPARLVIGETTGNAPSPQTGRAAELVSA